MLTKLCNAALLASESRADKIWRLWAAAEIDNETAAIKWATLARKSLRVHSGHNSGEIRRRDSTMLLVTDEHKFWDLTSAAEHMFAYLRESIVELTGTSAWSFDRGNVSSNGDSAYAQFSCVGGSGLRTNKLVISAIKQPDGTWAVAHTVERAAS